LIIILHKYTCIWFLLEKKKQHIGQSLFWGGWHWPNLYIDNRLHLGVSRSVLQYQASPFLYTTHSECLALVFESKPVVVIFDRIKHNNNYLWTFRRSYNTWLAFKCLIRSDHLFCRWFSISHMVPLFQYEDRIEFWPPNYSFGAISHWVIQ
jgi:hypothetical protein